MLASTLDTVFHPSISKDGVPNVVQGVIPYTQSWYERFIDVLLNLGRDLPLALE